MSYEPAEAFQFERVREGGGCKSGGSALIISSYALSTLCGFVFEGCSPFQASFFACRLSGPSGNTGVGSTPVPAPHLEERRWSGPWSRPRLRHLLPRRP